LKKVLDDFLTILRQNTAPSFSLGVVFHSVEGVSLTHGEPLGVCTH